MATTLIGENILKKSDFASATEQEGEHWGQPIPDSANEGQSRLLSKETPEDFVFDGTTEAGTIATTIVCLSLRAFGDDYFIGGIVTMTSGAESGNSRAVTDFVQVNGNITVAAFGGAPGVGETFILTMAFATRDFRVELISSGDAGDATFKWSHGGGTTWLGRDDPLQANWLAENVIDANTLADVICIQAENHNIVAVYKNRADNAICGKISVDNGITWSAAIQITALNIRPRVLVLIPNIGRIMLFTSAAAYTFYSDDNSETWISTGIALPEDFSDVAVLFSGVMIAVYDSGTDIYCRVSNDMGFNWSAAITISTAVRTQQEPTIVQAQNGDIICAYSTDEDVLNNDEIKGKISSDGGATWGSTIDIINFTNNFYYPHIRKDVNGTLILACIEATVNNIVFTYSTNNGQDWNPAGPRVQDLKVGGGDSLSTPYLAIVDGHQIFCCYYNATPWDGLFVRRGMWELHVAGTNDCPAAIEAIPQHLICDAHLIWHGGAGIDGDEWQFEAEYDYSMVNLIEDSPSKPWRSERDDILCEIYLDIGMNERYFVDGLAFFNCNVRNLHFQMSHDNWITIDVDETLLFDICEGTVDSMDGNALEDSSLMANYKDHELAERYYLRMASGTDVGKTWLIRDNVDNYIFLETDSPTNIAADDTFLVYQKQMGYTFLGAVHRYMKIVIPAQHTAENYYQLGTAIIGKRIELGRRWAPYYSRSHRYNIDMLRTPQAGLIPMRQADRQRIFTLEWPFSESTRKQIVSLTDWLQGKNIALLPEMTEHEDSKLYGGTRDNGKLYEWNDANAWVEVAPQLAETYILSLAVYNGKLYGGTFGNGKLYEWNGVNLWVEVAPQLGVETGILSLAVYNGKLYGGTNVNGKLYEWNDVNLWVQVAPQLGVEIRIWSLAVYNGKLYGGTGDLGNLYEWNGAAWVQVAPQLNAEAYIYSLAVYNGKLYGGTGDLGNLYEWNGAAWVQVAPQLNAEAYIYSLAVYNGKLYGGTAPNGKLYEWNDVDAWVEVAPRLGVEIIIYSLAVYNKNSLVQRGLTDTYLTKLIGDARQDRGMAERFDISVQLEEIL